MPVGETEFLPGFVDDSIKDLEHMSFCLVYSKILIFVVLFQILCAEVLRLKT